ncbi:MAG TPA: hypothetical protein VLA17_12700, partial [Candidatus Limnocylindria bacterium]|nr:hypothetical protein [Candidatus Limnocylindria bacterium]
MLKNDACGLPFIASVAIHACLFFLAPAIFSGGQIYSPVLFPVALVDLPRQEPAPQKIDVTPEIKKPLPPAPAKINRPKEHPSPAKSLTTYPL